MVEPVRRRSNIHNPVLNAISIDTVRYGMFSPFRKVLSLKRGESPADADALGHMLEMAADMRAIVDAYER